jgi:hypothetical protein
MGYSVMFYSLDLPKLKAYFSSKDKAFFNLLLEKYTDDIEGHDESYADEIEEDGWPTMKDALKQILSGKLKVVEDAEFTYGYALKIICEEIGELMAIDGLGVSDVRRVPFATAMMDNGPPIPIPPDTGDFPQVGHLSEEEVVRELAAFASVAEVADPYLNCEITGFRQILQDAAKAGKAVVAFRH